MRRSLLQCWVHKEQLTSASGLPWLHRQAWGLKFLYARPVFLNLWVGTPGEGVSHISHPPYQIFIVAKLQV